jgi:pyrroloquinoline-quinone synthase
MNADAMTFDLVTPGLDELWSSEEFLKLLRNVGERQYHHRHTFHRRMNNGLLSKSQIRIWVANRFHYQRNLPVKDASILANCPFSEIRRSWRQRLVDQDGAADGQGGIEAWLRFAEAVGLSRAETLDSRHVVPGVAFAVESYVTLARCSPWPVAVASSLTELFAPDLMAERLAAFRQYYSWVPSWGLEYFESRVGQARRDSEQGLSLTLKYCDTPALQRAALKALRQKCDILWALLDAIDWKCREEVVNAGHD